MNERNKTRFGIVAVALIFFLNGGISAAIPPRYAEISAALGLDPGALGIALVGSTIGLGVGGTILAAGLSERFGSRFSFGLPLVLFCLSPALIAVANSGPTLFGSQVFQGISNAPVDLAQGVLAMGLAAKAGKRLLPRFQAVFSCGSLSGAAAGAAAAGRLGVVPFLFGLATVAVALAIVSWRFLPAPGEEEEGTINNEDDRGNRTMWAIAILAFFALLAEFIGQDWASVFYRSELHAAPSQYGYGGFAFQVGFVFVLVIGERFARRFGDARVVASGAVIFATAMAIFVVSHSVLVATVALFFAGVGAGNGVPLTLSAITGHPRYKLWTSRVTTVMYFGAGASRLVGLLTEEFSLRWALSLAVPVGAVIVAMALRLLSGQPHGPEARSSEHDVRVRRLTAEDLRHAVSIERRSFPPSSEVLSGFAPSLSDPNAICLAADCDGELVGYVISSRMSENWYVWSIAVAPKHRRRGVAGALLRRLFEEAPGQQFTLQVRVSNRRAIGMYEHFGFTSRNVVPGYYSDNGEAALTMWLDRGGMTE